MKSEFENFRRVTIFDGWREYVDYVNRPCGWEGPSSRRDGRRGEVDQGTKTFDAAIKLALRGWPDGAALAREQSAQLVGRLGHPEPIEDWRREIVGGGNLSVPVYVSGAPDCFLNYSPTDDMQDKFVTVVINSRLSGSISFDVCMMRGVILCAMVDALESSGYRCRVYAGFANGGGAYNLEVYIPIKDFGESLDLDLLAYTAAHASFHRRLNWSYKELLPAGERWDLGVRKGGGYGGSGSMFSVPADIRIDENVRFRTAEQAANYIKPILAEKYGVTFV